MAEICSAYPTAGSVYHWAGQLAPKEYAAFASYWTGITNWLGNSAGDASFAFAFAQVFSGSLSISSSINLSTDDEVGIAIGILLLWSCLNFFRIDSVGWIMDLGAFLQIATLVVILFTLLMLAPKLNSPDFVFFDYNNDTGINSVPYVASISLLYSLWSFSGYDASAHLAEETQGSRVNAPMGIIYTVAATAIGGFVYTLALLFAVQNITGAIDSSTGSAAVAIFVQATPLTCAIGLSWLVVANVFFAGLSSVAVTARITFALLRDKATPYWEVLSAVHPTFKSPVNAIIVVFVFDAFLLLLPLSSAGETAFFSLVGVATVGFQVSYGLPIFLKFFYSNSNSFPETPMSLGAWSAPMNCVAWVWLFGTAIVFFLPETFPITASNMNYSVAVFGFIVIAGTLNWVFISSHTFKGPRRPDDDDFLPALDSSAHESSKGGSDDRSIGERDPLLRKDK